MTNTPKNTKKTFFTHMDQIGIYGARNLSGAGRVHLNLSLFASTSLSSLSTALPLIICSRVQAGQPGRGPRFRETRDPVLLVSGKVGAHTRDNETDR